MSYLKRKYSSCSTEHDEDATIAPSLDFVFASPAAPVVTKQLLVQTTSTLVNSSFNIENESFRDNNAQRNSCSETSSAVSSTVAENGFHSGAVVSTPPAPQGSSTKRRRVESPPQTPVSSSTVASFITSTPRSSIKRNVVASSPTPLSAPQSKLSNNNSINNNNSNDSDTFVSAELAKVPFSEKHQDLHSSAPALAITTAVSHQLPPRAASTTNLQTIVNNGSHNCNGAKIKRTSSLTTGMFSPLYMISSVPAGKFHKHTHTKATPVVCNEFFFILFQNRTTILLEISCEC
jgi:hypothetical protein